MWLSQQLRPAPATTDADLRVTTIAGSSVGVVTRGEVRTLPVYGPGGYVWMPENGVAVLVGKEAVMAAMGLFVIRRTREVYSARWHGKLATCILYGVILTHIVWYSIPQQISGLLALAGAAGILLSLALYTLENIRRVRK